MNLITSLVKGQRISEHSIASSGSGSPIVKGQRISEHSIASSGSGSPIAYGVLESVYDKELTNEQAKQIATKAVSAAMERDPGSGNGIDLLVIPKLLVIKEQKKNKEVND